MSINIEEIDYQKTSIGELILRRRRFPILGEQDVFEVILNEEFLMSSLFTAGEIALAELGLESVEGSSLDIIVGGLGLGYTAVAALEDARVSSMTVIEALPNVISWHERELLPVSPRLTQDPRCIFHQGNFFDLARNRFEDLTANGPTQAYHAVLLDIDHSPEHVLHPSNQSFYSLEGLKLLRDSLYPGGVFALWSNDAIEESFLMRFDQTFSTHSEHVVEVPNPITGISSSNTIYVGQRSL